MSNTISVHDIGPSGRCVLCSASTERTEEKNATETGIHAAKLVEDRYLSVHLSICDECHKKRFLWWDRHRKWRNAGAIVGLLFGVGVSVLTIASGRFRVMEIGSSLCAFPLSGWLLATLTTWVAKRIRTAGEPPLPSVVLHGYDPKTGMVSFQAPFPENMRRLS